MPKVPEFYSVTEAIKHPLSRVHHNNSACGPAAIFRNVSPGKAPAFIGSGTTVSA
jgi:hypothetical protein